MIAAYTIPEAPHIPTGRQRSIRRHSCGLPLKQAVRAATAIKEMNLAEIGGRPISVDEARPKTDRPRRGGGRSCW